MADYTLATITIQKVLTDGEALIYIDTTTADDDSLDVCEALGMIELAKDVLLRPGG